MVLRAAPALGAGFALPTRLRTLDEDPPLDARFDPVFALEAGSALLIFDFVVFFDFLRAAIVILSTRDRTRFDGCANSALPNSEQILCQNRDTLSGNAHGHRLHD